MLDAAIDHTDATRAPPGAPAMGSNEASLRAELEALNEELRVLTSTDHSVRAYVETWLGIIATTVSIKLAWDWFKATERALLDPSIPHKPPIVAIPLVLLALGLFADAIKHRLAFRRLAASEGERLARQRELRQQLGFDELELPEAGEAGPAVALS